MTTAEQTGDKRQQHDGCERHDEWEGPGIATTATWVRRGLNFVVPFLVSNTGLLSGRR